MLLDVSSLGSQPSVGSAYDLLVCPDSPVVLTLRLGRSERLEHGQLVLRRMDDGAGMPSPSILSESSTEGSVRGVEWIGAGWGDPRRMQGLTLAFAGVVEPPRLRVLVDRGDGTWRPLSEAPTVTALSVDGVTRLHVTFDAVATRVRVELLDLNGAPVAMDLDEVEPLQVEIGEQPEELSLCVRGHEPFIRWSGPIPEGGGLTIDDLLAALPPEQRPRDPETPLVLELRAQVAGDLELWWSFATSGATDSLSNVEH